MACYGVEVIYKGFSARRWGCTEEEWTSKETMMTCVHSTRFGKREGGKEIGSVSRRGKGL